MIEGNAPSRPCPMAGERKPNAVVDLLGRTGTGPLFVLLVVLDGGGTARIDGQEHALAAGNALLVEKGSSRAIRAGSDGLRYLSVHRRRGPLQIDLRALDTLDVADPVASAAFAKRHLRFREDMAADGVTAARDQAPFVGGSLA